MPCLRTPYTSIVNVSNGDRRGDLAAGLDLVRKRIANVLVS